VTLGTVSNTEAGYKCGLSPIPHGSCHTSPLLPHAATPHEYGRSLPSIQRWFNTPPLVLYLVQLVIEAAMGEQLRVRSRLA